MNALGKYRKVIVTGHVVEIYEYEKAPMDSPEFAKKDTYKPFDYDDVEMPKKEDREDERRKQTVRDARNTTRRLAIKNFESGDKFLTLTFDPKRFTEELLRVVGFSDDFFFNFIILLSD